MIFATSNLVENPKLHVTSLKSAPKMSYWHQTDQNKVERTTMRTIEVHHMNKTQSFHISFILLLLLFNRDVSYLMHLN